MSLNKVMLIGNVGKDPDVKTFDNGNRVANLTIATTERGYTKQDGTQIPDKTEWHNIVVWNGPAKVVEQYVKKGTKIFIEGKIRTRSYESSDGGKRYITEIFAENIELLSKVEQQGYGEYQPSGSPIVTQDKHTIQSNSDDLPF